MLHNQGCATPYQLNAAPHYPVGSDLNLNFNFSLRLALRRASVGEKYCRRVDNDAHDVQLPAPGSPVLSRGLYMPSDIKQY